MIINLVSNALKFTKKGGITIKAAMSEFNSNSFKISVRDTGPGISDENKSKLFKMFGRVTGEDNKHGIGLGLQICSKIID